MRCQDFSLLPRRERRAYPPAVCKERATLAAAKKTATRRAAPDLTSGFVAPQSQSAHGYAPSSRLARGQIRRGAGIAISWSQYEVDEFFEPKYKTASAVGGYRRFQGIHDFCSYFLKLQLE